MSVLSLGLLLPFGTGGFSDRAMALVIGAAESPVKHVTLVRGTERETVETRSANVDALLAERGIARQPEDSLSSPPEASLTDGMTLEYRPAVEVTLTVDGTTRQIRTAAATVGDLLAAQHVTLGSHDGITPAAGDAIVPAAVVQVKHATSWLERFRTQIAPPVTRKFDVAMTSGAERVVDPGRPGTRETTIAVLAPSPSQTPTRTVLAMRVLRAAHARVVAVGVGDATSLGRLARRGFVGTVRLADAALSMVATAYTASCSGCSGTTASGRPAGHGIVAVDPRIIPLGTRLFIPGYGHAFAGDTGGAIRGNRIDLGFDRHRDALTFGRRAIVVYVLK